MSSYEQSDDRNRNVPNQTLNLVIITLELNNPERKWDKVGILESAPPLEYVRNTTDHFSYKAANRNRAKGTEVHAGIQVYYRKYQGTPLNTVNCFQTNAEMSLKRVVQDIHSILLDTEMNMPGTKSVLL